ncbi:MAG: DJ-1/PfpI family protein [Parvibaculum sp.]
MPKPNPLRHIVIFAYEDGMMLDAVGPADVFSTASHIHIHETGGPAPYQVEVTALNSGPVTMSNGLAMMVKRSIAEMNDPIDTLIVCGGSERGLATINASQTFFPWLTKAAARTRRVGSVCSGAFLLAKAGLLNGHRATTHWVACERLGEQYPAIELVRDAIYVKSGNLYTSAGVSAGIDLALAMVEEDLGRDIAMKVARHLVLFLRRPGGQSQFSAQLAAQTVKTDRFDDLLTFIVNNPHAELNVTSLAAHMAMSPRNFARLFREQVGETPAKYVERARLDAARRKLEEDDDKVERVAAATGFGTAETLRRTMKRHMATTPEAYRATFGG